MSIYIQFDETGPQAQAASNLGWSEFTQWVESLPADTYPSLLQFTEHGATEKLPALLTELEAALEANPPDIDVEDIADGIITALHTNELAECILLTSGVQPDEDDSGKYVSEISKSNPGHAGRPGHIGGSASRSGHEPTIPKGPFAHAKTAQEALEALSKGQYVELPPSQVTVLFNKLAKIARDAEKLGVEAPRYNMCKIIIEGMSPFCHGTEKYARIKMPRIPRSENKQFKQFLRDKDIQFEKDKVPLHHLKPSQNEIDGAKIASAMKAHRGGDTEKLNSRIFVSSDNYIIDGHHKWGAKVGLEYVEGKEGELKMKVTRVNLPITALYKIASEYTDWAGHARQKEAGFACGPAKRLKVLEIVSKGGGNPNHAPAGTSHGGGLLPAIVQGFLKKTQERCWLFTKTADTRA